MKYLSCSLTFDSCISPVLRVLTCFIYSGIKKNIDMKILWNVRGIGAGAD